jgi:hypothetical protein
MGVLFGVGQPRCLLCSVSRSDVRERGRLVPLWADLCDSCWNGVANELALAEGATAAALPQPDPEDMRWIEPRTCRRCRAMVRCCPTNYDRWVELATFELPAKKVSSKHRWRLMSTTAAKSPFTVGTVAVRVGAIDPTPGEPVVPAHEFVCRDGTGGGDPAEWL